MERDDQGIGDEWLCKGSTILHEMELQNVRPMEVAMLAVLSASSHGGLIEDGPVLLR